MAKTWITTFSRAIFVTLDILSWLFYNEYYYFDKSHLTDKGYKLVAEEIAENFIINKDYISKNLQSLTKDTDLSKFIL